jgi:hypothetical protein
MKMTRRQAGYDRCRALGHAWYEVDADRQPPFGFYFWTKCESCDTVRRDIRTRWGDLLSRVYDYADDYRDTEQHARSDWYARLMAPRLPEVDSNEKKLGRDIDAIKERLREARRLERQGLLETTATTDARPAAPARAPKRKTVTTTRRRAA